MSADSERVTKEGAVRQLLVRNAVFLTIAQVGGMPLSLVQSAITARYLGPTLVGYIYLAVTFNSFGFLAVEWGQGNALPAMVAVNHGRAGRLLGTALVWRALSSVIVSVALFACVYLLGYDSQLRTALWLMSVSFAISAMSNGCQFAIFGFERMDVAARRQGVEQLLNFLIVVPVLVLGGKLIATLVGCLVVTVGVLLYVWRSVPGAGVGRLSFDPADLRSLLRAGTPFVFFGLAMVLQPYVDALFLAKLSPHSVGWQGAARKLVGFLVFPAAAVSGALYPTLCRLHATDTEGFKTTTSEALRAMSAIVVPVALGCALFPDVGVSVYGRKLFAPAEDDLQVLSLFLALVFFSMPIGNCLLAAGRQRAWALVQLLCVAVSIVLDPLLVPWFERRYGNGGLGVCWTAVLSEAFVVAIGVVLMPSGIFNRPFWRTFGSAMLSGIAMAGAARALSNVTSFVVAPLSLVVYATTLWLTGGVEREHIHAVRRLVRRKLGRGQGTFTVSGAEK